jgi:hypothetical protein
VSNIGFFFRKLDALLEKYGNILLIGDTNINICNQSDPHVVKKSPYFTNNTITKINYDSISSDLVKINTERIKRIFE